MKKVAVIGGGAAGFFGALQLKEQLPDVKVVILEKSQKLLSKVKISGGGRCNVTHSCFVPRELVKNYPRGERELKSVFSKFQTGDTIAWFADKGIELKTEDDGRMFPATDSSQTIIDCFLKEASRHKIEIRKGAGVQKLEPLEKGFRLEFRDSDETFDVVLVTIGGGNKLRHYSILNELNLDLVEPIPSLFTFNIPDTDLHALQGLSFNEVEVKIEGQKFMQFGDVLITHWGLSGPAVLKLSAFAADYFHAVDYQFSILVNWIAMNQEQTREELLAIKNGGAKSFVYNELPGSLPMRMKRYLIKKAGIPEDKRWVDVSKKEINRLVQVLSNCRYEVNGTTTFKEEFVTCGGVESKELDWKSMESKKYPGLFFAGEVLNVDGITGGFNFQNAWSTSYIAATGIIERLNDV